MLSEQPPELNMNDNWREDPYWRAWGVLYILSWGDKRLLWLLLCLFIFQLIVIFNPDQYSVPFFYGFFTNTVIFCLILPWTCYQYLKNINVTYINEFVKGKLKAVVQIAAPRWVSGPMAVFAGLGMIVFFGLSFVQKGLPGEINELINHSLAWVGGVTFCAGLYLVYFTGILVQRKIFQLSGIDKQSLVRYLTKSDVTAPKLEN